MKTFEGVDFFNIKSLLGEEEILIRDSVREFVSKEVIPIIEKALPEIKSLDARLIAISPNTPDNSITSIEKHGLEFEVLTDAENNIANEFRLVFNLAEELRPIYQQFNFDLPKYNDDESWDIPIPATYIVNRDGKIAHAFVNADYTQRMEPTEIISILKELTVQKQQAIN